MPDDRRRIGAKDFPITHLNTDGFSAVQAKRIDTNGFTGKQPADCQRVRTSLAEPFLLTVDGYPVLGGYKRKWGYRGDPVCVGDKPYRSRADFLEIMKELEPFFCRTSQPGGQLGIMCALPCLYQAAHNELICFIEGLNICHGFTSH